MGIIIDLWQEIYSTVKRNKLRTFLTGFAVSWGIFMLIVLLGAGNGIINTFEAASGERARNSIKIWSGRTSKPFDGLKQGRRVQIYNSDVEITETHFPDHVVSVGASMWQGGITLTNKQEYITVSLGGVYPNYPEVEAIKMVPGAGRFLNDLDIWERRKVLVLHQRTADALFRDEDPIGKYLTSGKVAYQVVGIYTDPGEQTDRPGYIPYTTLEIIYNKGGRVNDIVFTTQGLETVEANETFEEEYRRVLAAYHRYAPDDKSAIGIWNRFTDYMQMQTGMNIIRTALWIIGIFTLLSGIVGVSNIMLITVKERTREFGIRKALGAKPSSILILVILESIIITTIFGYIGLVLGIGATEWMNMQAGNTTINTGGWSETVFLNPTVDTKVAIQATLTLIIAGTLAGFFPARKAVTIRPIKALRAE